MNSGKSLVSIAVKFGIITAAVIAALALLFYFAHIKESYMMMILVLVAMGGGVFAGINSFKKGTGAGLDFFQSMKAGIIISVIAALVVAVANFFFFEAIDHDYIYEIFQSSPENLYTSSEWMSLFIFLAYTIYGVLATFFVSFLLVEKPVKGA